MLNKYDNMTFWGVPVRKEIEKGLQRIHTDATRYMSESERTCYDVGISNALSVLDYVMSVSDERDIVFNDSELDMTEEYTIDDILERIDRTTLKQIGRE